MARKRRRKAAPAKGTSKRLVTGGKRKRRKRKMKLTLRSRGIKKKKDEYKDALGWTTTGTSQAAAEASTETLPDIVMHQCSMCGAMNKIPRPKRDRYKVICAQEECGNEDKVGFDE